MTAPPSYGTGNKSSDPQSQLRFLPVIPLALRLLQAVPPKTYDGLTWAVPPKAHDWLVDVLIHAARQTKTPGRVSDIIQGLVEDRKQLGVYHTLPASAALMAHLAVPEDNQLWSNPQKAMDFRMADYACGCGELLTAAYRRLRELHQAQGQDPSDIHHQMMTNAITAVDVLPASVAIAATELDLLEAEPKGTPSSQTRAITLQQGPITNRRNEKKTTAEAGKKPKQRPVGLGSLDLLDPRSLQDQERKPVGRKLPQKNTKPMKLTVKSQDLVIMNPPYTRPTGTAGMDRNIPGGRHAVPPTSPEELRKMELRMRRIRKAAHAGVGTGMGLHFSHIADLMVKPRRNHSPASTHVSGYHLQREYQQRRGMVQLSPETGGEIPEHPYHQHRRIRGLQIQLLSRHRDRRDHADRTAHPSRRAS